MIAFRACASVFACRSLGAGGAVFSGGALQSCGSDIASVSLFSLGAGRSGWAGLALRTGGAGDGCTFPHAARRTEVGGGIGRGEREEAGEEKTCQHHDPVP